MIRRGRAELGMGTAGIGNLYSAIDNAQAQDTVEAALQGGISFFDTAPHYGFGLAERRLGAALEQSPAGRAARVSTKVGRILSATSDQGTRHGFASADPFEPLFDYSRDAVLRAFTGSLVRLRRERIDVLLAHDLGELTHGAAHQLRLAEFLDGGYPAMVDLKREGAVGAIGVGVNEVAICLELIERIELDTILLAGRYTLLEQGAIDRLMGLCEARGIDLIIGGPFNSGILTGDPAHAFYDYGPAPEAIRRRAAEIARICVSFGVPVTAAALQFPAAHGAVNAVIPGLSSRTEVEAAMDGWQMAIPPELWDALVEEDLIDRRAPCPPLADAKAAPVALLLHALDNVMIAGADLDAGSSVLIDGVAVPIASDIQLGHKLARHTLGVGDPVIKHGVPIGTMTAPATPGQHVHLHNLTSDYMDNYHPAAGGEPA